MPIYEYICEECQEELEIIQKISEEPLSKCPSCHKNSLKKKTSMSAFHLKGGGWYKDGYGAAKNENGTKPSKPKDTATGSSSSASPAKSTETKSSKDTSSTSTTPSKTSAKKAS